MPQIRRIATLVLLTVVLLATPGLAQSVDVSTGQTPNGAYYTIAVPTPWNGAVVIYNHGFSLTPGGPGPDLGPLQDLMLLEGYAIAASSYSQTGWALFESTQDIEQLMAVFRQDVGEPAQILMFGISLGGAVTVAAIEQAAIGPVAGALTLCGANAGSRNFDGGLDLRLVYDAICQAVVGANIPGAAKGLPLFSTLTPLDIAQRSNACFGQDLPPSMRTAAQQKRLDLFLSVMQIPQSFINTTLGFFATFGMADLVHDPGKLGGRIGTGNKNVDYGNPTINATIQRVVPRSSKRQLFRRNYTPTGEVGDTKIVSIHTDKDGLVIVENAGEYASLVAPQNITVGVIVEAVPTHCGASPAELGAGWETLRGRVAGDPPPSALTLAVMCGALEPVLGGPCRISPGFQIPDMDGRIRPRNPANAVRAQKVRSAVAPSTPGAAPASPAASPAPSVDAPAPSVQPEPSRPTRFSAAADETSEALLDAESRVRAKFERREH